MGYLDLEAERNKKVKQRENRGYAPGGPVVSSSKSLLAFVHLQRRPQKERCEMVEWAAWWSEDPSFAQADFASEVL